MVVDDDPLILRMMARALETAGFDTLCCRSGDEAVEALAKYDVAVVVSDVGMPGMSGLDLLDSVRRSDPELPLILISGDGNGEQQARELGAFGYFLKPLHLGELLASVGRAADGRR